MLLEDGIKKLIEYANTTNDEYFKEFSQNLSLFFEKHRFKHNLNDYDTFCKLVEEHKYKEDYDENLKGVIHCYSYGLDSAKEYLDMGFYFGIGGTSTYKGNDELRQVIEFLPIENIVLETDCPYLSPVPKRGKRNDSSNLIYVAENIANIKGLSTQEVINITNQNAKKLYNLK